MVISAKSQKPDITSMVFDLRWLRVSLLRWFKENGRRYPWRETKDPYCILLAEMMLRRTWADQVEPIYRAFVGEYPDAKALANADPARVEQILWPLGLDFRTRDILKMSQDLQEMFACEVPHSREELKRLTGVGDYVAGAVLSIAFNQPEWIIDTNVVRVFQRFFDLGLKGEARRHPVMISLAQKYAQSRLAGRANLALLDHAATICKPKNPLCLNCPLSMRCKFFQEMKRVKSFK